MSGPLGNVTLFALTEGRRRICRQAEAVADAFREAQGEAEVATKRDLERLEAQQDARFERVDGELRLN